MPEVQRSRSLHLAEKVPEARRSTPSSVFGMAHRGRAFMEEASHKGTLNLKCHSPFIPTMKPAYRASSTRFEFFQTAVHIDTEPA
jgi:hypothetical protein